MARLSQKHTRLVKPEFQINGDYLPCVTVSLTLYGHTWKFVF